MLDTNDQVHKSVASCRAPKIPRLSKYIATAVIVLLTLGYLGVNLFDWNPNITLSVRAASAFLIFIIFVLSGWVEKITLPLLVLGLCSVINIAYNTISINILYILIFVLATRALPINYISTISTYITGATIVLSVALFQLGLTENIVDVTGSIIDIYGEDRERNSYGYKNVNAFSGLISGFCLLLMLTGRSSLWRYVAAVSISFLFYRYTDSRTLIGSTVLFIFFLLAFNAMAPRRSALYIMSSIAVISPVVISLIPSIILDHAPLVDLVLSNRFLFSAEYLSSFQPYQLLIGGAEPRAGLPIDNSFVLIAGAIGIPLTIYLVAQVLQSIRVTIDCRDQRTYAFVMSFWIFSFSESSFVRPESIIALTFWMIILYRSKIRSLRANFAS